MSDPGDKAQAGLAMLEAAIMEALRAHPTGLYNNEIARLLKIESSHEGKQSNYLTYSVLGGLLTAGQVRKEKRDGRTYYLAEPL